MWWMPAISTAVALLIAVKTVSAQKVPEPTAPGIEVSSIEPEPEAQADGEPSYQAVTEAELPYVELFVECGIEHGIEPSLLAGVAAVESTFRPDAISHAGAQGITQFMPKTAAAMEVDPWQPRSAICGTARYLLKSHQIHGNWPEAIAAYNAGDPAVTQKGVNAADGDYVIDVEREWRLRKN